MNTQAQEFEWELIWYNLDKEIKRDKVKASSAEEAVRKGYLLYNGVDNAPAKMVSVTRVY